MLLFSCMSCLYILHINLLSVISFANIFFHSVDCVFVLSMASFAVKKKPLSLIRSYLFHFVFISLAFILLSLLQQNEHVVCYFIHSFFFLTLSLFTCFTILITICHSVYICLLLSVSPTRLSPTRAGSKST